MRKEKDKNGFAPTPICIVPANVEPNSTAKSHTTISLWCRCANRCEGFSLVELIVAFAIIVIIFAAVVPQFRAIRNSWTSTEAQAEIIQNGRILAEHITRNLSAAKKIIGVSPSSQTSGFIRFKDNNDVNQCYMLSGGYVVFGAVGSEAQLAGPVDRLQISCYSLNDLNHPTADVNATDVNAIRLVQIETDFPNNDTGTDRTFTASAYLQTNANTKWGLIGHWKLDETSGTTATDSSGNGGDGTLYNMATPGCWVAGQIGGALSFDGSNDYVSRSATSTLNLSRVFTISAWVYFVGDPAYEYIVTRNTSTTANMQYGIYVRTPISGGALGVVLNGTTPADFPTVPWPEYTWSHIAVTWNGNDALAYVDGGLIGSVHYPGTLTNQGNWFNIGRRSNSVNGTSSSGLFSGIIDDVRIYNYAMSAQEVAQLANILKFRTFEEAKVSSDSNYITIPKPSDVNVGDLLIAAVATDESSTPFTGVPSGWTQIDCTAYGTAVTLGAWQKIAGASEPASYNFTWTGGQQAYGWMMRFTGHDPNNPIHIWSAYNDSSITPTSPEVTTTLSNCLILRLGAFDDGDVNTLPEPGYPGLPGHTAITMDKSSSGGTGAVAILGSWATGTTHAKESGTNRALIFIAHWEDNVAPSLTVTYGGQTMTKVIDITAGTSSFRNYVAAFILNEAGITAATSGTFVPTWGDPPSSVSYASVFLQNVDQTDIIGATDSASTTSSTNPIETDPLSTGGGDMVIVAAVCGNNGSYTLNNGFIEGTDQSVGANGHTGVTGHKSATGVAETPRATFSGTVGRQAIIGFVVQGIGLEGAVSGGAGYVRQLVSGNSETSTFSLGSSNEARTLTIAIAAPASQDVYCGGQIRP